MERATWTEAGPHGMKSTSFRSRTLNSALWTSAGSTSPSMMLRHEMYFPLRGFALTMMF